MTVDGRLRVVGGRDHDSAAKLRRLYLLQLIPLLGVLAFAGDGALAMRDFAHNNSLACTDSFGTVAGCSHYSYAVPVAVGVGALLLVIGGGLYASYYAARHFGLPLFAALRRRGLV